MTPFRRRGDRMEAGFVPAESAVLTLLLDELEQLLAGDGGAVGDPVVARLFPAGHASDPELARDYRELTESSLREGKAEDLALVRATIPVEGGAVRLDVDQARSWLRTTNDLRLALGARLGITAEGAPEDTDEAQLSVYHWLTALQGSLVDALVAGGSRPR
ncbi:protein of unknown function [Klenkia marina]|uniref:Uncharacterized protein n=1 Tax=Klenkia marina TaxID=1960309 RepID=A0A1G4Z641_9ACTN|nr:DUF2017 family protein [Klenkia marina]SCX61139.1 protein of unknown function [Klenkia marina]